MCISVRVYSMSLNNCSLHDVVGDGIWSNVLFQLDVELIRCLIDSNGSVSCKRCLFESASFFYQGMVLRNKKYHVILYRRFVRTEEVRLHCHPVTSPLALALSATSLPPLYLTSSFTCIFPICDIQFVPIHTYCVSI